MRRGILGLCLLLSLLAGSIWADRAGKEKALEISQTIYEAGQCAMEEQWHKAAALTRMAGAAWRDTRFYQHLLHNREPVHAVDVLFSQLEAYSRSRDPESYGAVCLSLWVRTGFLAGQALPRSPGKVQ